MRLRESRATMSASLRNMACFRQATARTIAFQKCVSRTNSLPTHTRRRPTPRFTMIPQDGRFPPIRPRLRPNEGSGSHRSVCQYRMGRTQIHKQLEIEFVLIPHQWFFGSPRPMTLLGAETRKEFMLAWPCDIHCHSHILRGEDHRVYTKLAEIAAWHTP